MRNFAHAAAAALALSLVLFGPAASAGTVILHFTLTPI